MSGPPFPWRLRPRGIALGTAHLVDLGAAREFVAPGFPIVAVWPGRTLGGLFLVDYGPGSILEYHELVACAALVRHAGRPCAWVTHVYVDDEASLRSGRAVLGVPKRLARFATDGRETTVVAEEDGPICTIRRRGLLALGRGRIRFCAAHLHAGERDGARVSIHGNEIAGRILIGRADVRIPPTSPLRALGLGRPLAAVGIADGEALFGGAPFLPFRTVTPGG